MLVRTLQIQVRRPVEPLSLVQYALVGHPRVKPNVERIGHLLVVLCVLAQ